MNIAAAIIKDLLQNFCTYIVPSSIFSILAGTLCWTIEKYGVDQVIIPYLKALKQNPQSRYRLLLYLYVYFIFDRTLFNRSFAWTDGLNNIMGGWDVFESKTEMLTFEAVENLAFFIPYIILLFLSFFENKQGLWVIKTSFYVGFGTSLVIEVCQMAFKLGEFQVSDLVYNTLGACFGGLLFWIIRFIKMKNRC